MRATTQEDCDVEAAGLAAYQEKRSRERLVMAWFKEQVRLVGFFKVNWLFDNCYRLNLYKNRKDRTIVASYFMVIAGVEGESDLAISFSSPSFQKGAA